MKLKLDDKGLAVLQDGKPVYIQDDGSEMAFDVPDLHAKFVRDGKRNGELAKELEAANTKLKTFEGIEDPVAALKAIETMKNIDAGQLIAAGKVEEIKAGAKKAVEEQIAAAAAAHKAEVEGLKANETKYKGLWQKVTLDNAFFGSKFIKDKIAIPIDLLRAKFGDRFSVDEESGNVIAVDGAGKAIQSRSKFGEPAEFEEAIELIVNEYPAKEMILSGARSRGDGARLSMNGSAGKTLTRQQFDALGPAEKMKAASTMQIID